MARFYATVTYNAVVEAEDIAQVYDAFPESVYLDFGLGTLDYDFSEVDERV